MRTFNSISSSNIDIDFPIRCWSISYQLGVKSLIYMIQNRGILKIFKLIEQHQTCMHFELTFLKDIILQYLCLVILKILIHEQISGQNLNKFEFCAKVTSISGYKCTFGNNEIAGFSVPPYYMGYSAEWTKESIRRSTTYSFKFKIQIAFGYKGIWSWIWS